MKATPTNMATPTADSLLDLERSIEADILDCLSLLEQGRNEALAELRRSVDAAGATSTGATQRLRSTAKASVEHVETVQRELGALNLALSDFVLTDSLTIENLEAFDTWRDRVLSALHNARIAIEALGEQGSEISDAPFQQAWRHFGQRLEIVRLHLQEDESLAAGEFAAQRRALLDRVEDLRSELSSDPKKAREHLHHLSTGMDDSADSRRLDGWIKALMMWRERGQQ